MTREVLLEIAVQDPGGVEIAAAVAAARVELCSALGQTGGLTPSLGLLEAVCAASTTGAGRVQVHPLIRPRPGGFVWSAAELDIQVRDVRAAVKAGAQGVVVGALTPAGAIDAVALAELVDAAAGAEVTFHRAVDMIADDAIGDAVDTLVSLGVTRVLTSGGAARSIDGVDRLAGMVGLARGRLQIMAGGGVRAQDVGALVAAGVDAVHLSAKRVVSAGGGPGGGGDAGYEVTDADIARAARSALDEVRRAGASEGARLPGWSG